MDNRSVRKHRPYHAGDYTIHLDDSASVAPPSFCAESTAAESCEIKLHSKAHRKCGPGHQLSIFICKIHSVFMRIYPVGWVPYSRQPLLGKASVFETVKTFAEQLTSHQVGLPGLSLKTIYRKVSLIRKLLGCGASDTEASRYLSAEILGFSTIDLNRLSQQIRAGPNLRSRAEALISFSYPPTSSTPKWLLCGYRKQCWGRG